jgi:hypothetical protein
VPASSSGGFEDPFDDSAPRAKTKRSTEAKKSGAFKDPFSEDAPSAAPARGRTPVVAMRDSSKDGSEGGSRRMAKESQSSGGGGTRSGWGVLKKQNRQ